MSRALDHVELAEMLNIAVPIHLATIDATGLPHITSLWFEWAEDAFWMTSLPDKPHVQRLRANPAAGLCVDVEEPERPDGERPNKQVRASGHADLLDDVGGHRTRRITEKYLRGPGRAAMIERRTKDPRVAIRIEPERLITIASV